MMGCMNQSNMLVQQENVCIHDAASCQTSCTTGLTTRCIMYKNILLLDQPVQWFVQWTVSRKQGFSSSSSSSSSSLWELLIFLNSWLDKFW